MAIGKRPTRPTVEEIRAFVHTGDVEATVASLTPEEKVTGTESPAPKNWTLRGNRKILSIGFSNKLLPMIDVSADKLSVSRTAFINMACSRLAREVLRDYAEEGAQRQNT
jgi:hypothetical protein